MRIRLMIMKTKEKREFITLASFGSSVAFKQPDPHSGDTNLSKETTRLNTIRTCHIRGHIFK
jgi:hypothetical protein